MNESTAHIPIYPPEFLWGAATSTYQIDGGIDNDWRAWELSYRKNGAALQACGLATNHGQLYEKDFELLASLGCNAYRMSLEWSRICPRPGKFNERAMVQAVNMISRLRGLDIEPMVTLHHFTHPAWFHQAGSWQDAHGLKHFLSYVDFVLMHLGKAVNWWVTINEPMVLVLGGYFAGMMPPGLKEPETGLRALANLIEAHNECYYRIHEVNIAAHVGIAHNMMAFAPLRFAHPIDLIVTRLAENFYNWALVEAIEHGALEAMLPSGIRRRNFSQSAAIDFWGINYYTRAHMQFDPQSAMRMQHLYLDAAGHGVSDLGWEIFPEGLDDLLRRMAKFGRPLVITENGIADADDSRRPFFLREHIRRLDALVKGGLPLAGYFHWSLLDNFEWLEGFRPRFGLFEVDYKTFSRRRRSSADLYATLIAERTLSRR
jgi:beta-glucosidase